MLEPQGRDDGHKLDYSKIEDGLWVGSNLCNPRTCSLHSEEFEKLGVEVEINLAIENNEKPPEDIVSYTFLPVVDGHAPSQLQLDIGVDVLSRARANGKKVYAHCKNGHGRSPTLIAAYLIRERGMAPNEANMFIRERRPEIHIEESQMEALYGFAKRWSK